jgi:hypothetical protein
MDTISSEIRNFLAAKENARLHAAQLVTLQILCGIDLTAVLASDGAARGAALARIDRLLNRERLKGLAGHWSYDLNRHIALKQAGDRLKASIGRPVSNQDKHKMKNGARRRRQHRTEAR